MHNALRAHENPALDAAICLARQNGLPLLVYHGLSEDYPFASDRVHAFLMQGHRDVQRELADRGIVAAFHLQRKGRRGPYLRSLTRAAAVLITEEMPVQPLTGWLERLTVTASTPIATVDCSCLAPVTQFDDVTTHAETFRQRAQTFHRRGLTEPYVEQTVDCPMADLEALREQLELAPLDLQQANLANLIGQCRIDHAIAPVSETPGGSRAGYARWEQFRQRALTAYHRSRHDPNVPLGSSRMSAYLHYGMVSPFRIARQVAEADAEAFLDELLIARELAFHFCYHHRDVIDSLEAVPDWAQESLQRHAQDPREDQCSWERLARGQTGRTLWDLAQRSLLKHGELHGQLRRTWGKAMIPWNMTPDRALQLSLDLNHRYALDGRSPASYGGILWCFGQFDRPVEQEQPVLGCVRGRDLQEQARQIDLDRYRQYVERPIAARLPRVAIIGAGIGGLTAARTLHDHGIDVTVFDKSRGPGGRTATRRVELDGGITTTFDHGAQFFTARDPRFRRLVASWIDDQLVEPWSGRIVQCDRHGQIQRERNETPRYVGKPGMNAVAQHLAEPLDVRYRTRVVQLSPCGQRWQLETEAGDDLDPFDLVLCNCPPAQAIELIGDYSALSRLAADAVMRPCWAMMIAAEELEALPFDAAFVEDSSISWLAANHRKPDRPGAPPSAIVHASPDWSERHLEDAPEQVMRHLRAELESLLGRRIHEPVYQTAHRWRYALADDALDVEAMYDAATGLGVCGDWCLGSRVEAAFLSGAAVAGSVLRHWTIDRPAFQWDQDWEHALMTG